MISYLNSSAPSSFRLLFRTSCLTLRHRIPCESGAHIHLLGYTLSVLSQTAGALATLHRGEREAIRLAQTLDADLIVLDEQAARTVAGQRGMHVIGTLGVLNEAGARGLVDIPEAVSRLRQTTFRAAPSLYKWLLDQHRQRTS